jgi:Fe-S-cluster containining protein
VSSADSVEETVVSRGDLHGLRDLHREIDGEVNRLSKIHADRLQCRRGCSACCLDDLTVTRVEAERIRSAHPDLLRNAEPHPVGGCAFLGEQGACRVYEDRPHVCRSQGLPLRVLFENKAGEIEERRDICPLNLDGGPPLEVLDEDDCWLIGPFELRIGQLEDRSGAADRNRIALRDLFRAD